MASRVNSSDYVAIRDEILNDPNGLGYSGLSPKQQLKKLMDKPDIANPDPVPNVPNPPTSDEVIDMLGTDFAKFDTETVLRADQLIGEQNFEGLGLLIKYATVKGWIDTTMAVNLGGLLVRVHPDPNHPATVKGEKRLDEILGRFIDNVSLDTFNKAIN